MPQKQKTSVTIQEDGTLLGADTGKELIAWLSNTFQLFADGRAEIVVQRPTRSLRQNRTLWGVVYPQVHEGLKDAGVHDLHLMDDDGHLMSIPVTVNFIHQMMKRRHLKPEEPGKEPTTRGLSTTEFTEYIRAIRHDTMLTKHDIHIEMPDDHPPVQCYE